MLTTNDRKFLLNALAAAPDQEVSIVVPNREAKRRVSDALLRLAHDGKHGGLRDPLWSKFYMDNGAVITVKAADNFMEMRGEKATFIFYDEIAKEGA